MFEFKLSDRESRALKRFFKVALAAAIVAILGELQRNGPAGIEHTDWRIIAYGTLTAVLAALEKWLGYYAGSEAARAASGSDPT